MKTIILPGFSASNRDWAMDIQKELDLGHEVLVHQWRHWEKGGSLALNYELKKQKLLKCPAPTTITLTKEIFKSFYKK